MTPKEYLKQSYRLDQKINSEIDELNHLRQMAVSISAPRLGDKCQTSQSTEAPFARSVEKMMELEQHINFEIDTLVDLKEQMRDVIAAVQNTDEQMVLRYRYIHNMTWEEIADKLHASKSTIRRWHSKALTNVVLPENFISVKS